MPWVSVKIEGHFWVPDELVDPSDDPHEGPMHAVNRVLEGAFPKSSFRQELGEVRGSPPGIECDCGHQHPKDLHVFNAGDARMGPDFYLACAECSEGT